MVDDSLKGASFGFEQNNSLMHHNEIINSSIIINIIVNGKNRTKDEVGLDYDGSEDSELHWMDIYDDAKKQGLVDRGFNVDPDNNVDPGFNVEAHQVAQPYLKPDLGLARVYHNKIRILEDQSNPPPA